MVDGFDSALVQLDELVRQLCDSVDSRVSSFFKIPIIIITISKFTISKFILLSALGLIELRNLGTAGQGRRGFASVQDPH